MRGKIMPALVIVAVVIIISIVGGGVTKANMDWYHTLQLPSFTPPGWVISVAWSLIYILSGIAAWRVWTGPATDIKRKMAVIAVANVLVNVGWSSFFFGMHLPWTSVAVAMLLAASVAAAIWYLWPRDRTSAILLLPYLLWVSFATFLTASIAVLN